MVQSFPTLPGGQYGPVNPNTADYSSGGNIASNPSIYYQDPAIAQAQGAYNSAQQTATDTSASAQTLPFLLKQALQTKFATSNPLVQQQGNAVQDYLNTTTSAPQSVTKEGQGGVILSPTQQGNLIQGKESGALSRLGTANFILNMATGALPDIIDSASGAAGAAATRSQGAASLALKNFQDLIDKAKLQTEAGLQEQGNQIQLKQLQQVLQLNPTYQQQQAESYLKSNAGHMTFDQALNDPNTSYLSHQQIYDILSASNPNAVNNISEAQARQLGIQLKETGIQSGLRNITQSFGIGAPSGPTANAFNPSTLFNLFTNPSTLLNAVGGLFGGGGNQEGSVTIRNSKTGETKTIPASQKSQYGL